MIFEATPSSNTARRRDDVEDALEAQLTVPSLPFDRFVWGAGIECSFLPHLNVDQFQWTQHDRFWREDFRRAKEELGISALRYAFPWHVIERERGKFDWSVCDERMDLINELKIDLFLDVMHFGTPLWLKQAVGDPEFPDSLERFADALVSRYRGRVRCWCPFNEPLVSALFSGDFGFWPPHSRKWRGYMPVLSRIVQGVSRAIRAIRRQDPNTPIVLCDAAENYRTRVPELQVEVQRRNLRRFVAIDLLSGRVDSRHPLFPWLTSYGMSDVDLDWFKGNPQSPDILGLDYYPHGDWQLDKQGERIIQRRAENPVGLYGVAHAYFDRYGLPMLVTETSVDGKPINREIWLDTIIDHTRRLREEGIPLLGIFWWPMIDQVDWDGALTHRIGKIHQVGLYRLERCNDGTLSRNATPLVKQFRSAVDSGEELVSGLTKVVLPAGVEDEQLPPVGEWNVPTTTLAQPALAQPAVARSGNGNGNGGTTARRPTDPVPGVAAEPPAAPSRIVEAASGKEIEISEDKFTDRYGIVVFSHLRWGFVWQRPQQFLSRFARKHQVLFVEEPFFDRREGAEPELSLHQVMPNVTVACPHLAPSWATNAKVPELLRKLTTKAINQMNEHGAFDGPLLWYYSPMDASWSLGHFANRGIVYDSMDELSQFTGAPPSLVANEQRLMKYADVVFTGGYELYLKKKQYHDNVHFFGCGVEFEHFARAQDPTISIPPDIDFLGRPILGWFGVVDERVDYAMLGEIARAKADWSLAIIGPVVKVDPNTLPHFPNLFWMGGRDYSVLPNYCRAFDVCLMPFANNASTQYINPTKALEYFATGRPVVSTPVRDVVRQYSDLVDIAGNTEGFIAAVERSLHEPDTDRIARGIEKARSCSWESTVGDMQKLIRNAITPKDRRSASKIAPVADESAGLAYVYQPTQGS